MTGSPRPAGRCWRSPSRAPGCSPGTPSGRCRWRSSRATGACSPRRCSCRPCSSSTRPRRCSPRCLDEPRPLDRDDRTGAGRAAAGGSDRQRRRSPDARQPAPDRRPAHLAHIHRPRLPQPLDRADAVRRTLPARCRLWQHCARRSENEDPDLPGDLGASRRWQARGARRLVPAGEHRRRLAPTSLRLLRSRLRGNMPDRGGSGGGTPGHAIGRRRVSAASMSDAPRHERATEAGGRGVRARSLPAWWPLAALTILAAALRLSTLDLQSFWYDEAFTPVHVLHPSLWATLRAVVHTENTPPLWYLLAWADSRVLGTGEVALRLPSALAGIATVPVAWAIGRELEGPRARGAAVVCAALVAVNPLFVWYSQEARAYALFVLMAALAMLCFLRARREPTPGWLAAFAVSASLALLSHYFAAFLVAPMVLWLLRGSRRPARPRGVDRIR